MSTMAENQSLGMQNEIAQLTSAFDRAEHAPESEHDSPDCPLNLH